jgi:hypothetical protein
MPGAGGSMLSVGRPRARQRRFDTQQPSFEDENPEQDMPDFSDTDSESDEEQTDQQKPVEPLITEDEFASEDLQSSSGKNASCRM